MIYNLIIDWYNAHLNYGTITLLMAVESSFIPFPSELVVPPAAYKALQPDSGLNIVLIVLFASIGAMIGAFINYYLAKFLGRPISTNSQTAAWATSCFWTFRRFRKPKIISVNTASFPLLSAVSSP